MSTAHSSSLDTQEPSSQSLNSSSPTSLDWVSVLSLLPSQPGVYWFLDKVGAVLYVGKAKNLKRRVTSYSQLNRLSSRILQLSTTATQLKYETLPSELEALLTEAYLINTYQPPFNILLKDDKSPLYIVITKETFPKVLQVRRKELIRYQSSIPGAVNGTIIGPFPSAYKVGEVLNIARHIFPWCNKTQSSKDGNSDGRPCFYYHLGQCPGACIGTCTPETYMQNIHQLSMFLKGKKTELTRQIERDLKQAVAAEQFEHAAVLRDRLKLIAEVTNPKARLKPELVGRHLYERAELDGIKQLTRLLRDYISLPKHYQLHRIEGYDVSNIQGTNAAVAQVVSLEGQQEPSEYRLFNIHTLDTPNDYHMLKEALTRRQNHPEWGKPDLVMVDGGKGQVRAAQAVWRWHCPIIGLAKDPDRIIIPIARATPLAKNEQKALKRTTQNYVEIKLPADHPALGILTRLRDEAHRFSRKQHRRIRQREMLQ